MRLEGDRAVGSHGVAQPHQRQIPAIARTTRSCAKVEQPISLRIFEVEPTGDLAHAPGGVDPAGFRGDDDLAEFVDSELAPRLTRLECFCLTMLIISTSRVCAFQSAEPTSPIHAVSSEPLL